METDARFSIPEIRTDGGAASNAFLMQFQADITGRPVVCPQVLETTARGAAFLAGLAVDYWHHTDDLETLWAAATTFEPTMSSEKRTCLIDGWQRALAHCRHQISEPLAG